MPGLERRGTAATIAVMGFRDFLAAELVARRTRNPRYSVRAFARDLCCDPASLSQMLRGRRAITAASADELCNALGLRGTDRERALAFEPLDREILFSIRTMAAPSVAGLAQKTNATMDEVNIALGRLMRLGLLRMEKKQWIVQAAR